MCCGRKRQAFRNASVLVRTPPPSSLPERHEEPVAFVPRAGTAVMRGPSTAVLLRHDGNSAVRAMGPVTGRRYDFAPGQAELPVDPRDAAVMLRQGAFHAA